MFYDFILIVKRLACASDLHGVVFILYVLWNVLSMPSPMIIRNVGDRSNADGDIIWGLYAWNVL